MQTPELRTVKEALELSAKTFNQYADYHYGKDTAEGGKKARANTDLFLQCSNALKELQAYMDRLDSEEFISQLAEQEPLDPEISKMIDEDYWDLVDTESAIKAIKGE